MNELLGKVSSYNIFNYLLPGVVFAVLGGRITGWPLVQKDIFVGAFLYYFLGLVVSRIGSLVVEPLLRSLSFVRFAPYSEFVAASERDGKLELLSEVNNTYRTMCSLLLLLLLLDVYARIGAACPILGRWGPTLLMVLLLILFLFSYRKQTSYIAKRVRGGK
jgi:hypothetical protein